VAILEVLEDVAWRPSHQLLPVSDVPISFSVKARHMIRWVVGPPPMQVPILLEDLGMDFHLRGVPQLLDEFGAQKPVPQLCERDGSVVLTIQGLKDGQNIVLVWFFVPAFHQEIPHLDRTDCVLGILVDMLVHLLEA